MHCPEDDEEVDQAALEGVLNEPKEDYEEAILNKDKKALSKLLARDRAHLVKELKNARPANINILDQARVTISSSRKGLK